MFREKKLLQAALTGDRQAFEKIVEKYQGMICAMTLCGTGRLDVSEDLAQETFLNAWKNLPQLRDLRKFRSWLCSIARNALQNYYRQKKPASLEDTDIETSVDEDLQDPSEILIQQETHLLLEQAIMRLPEKYRGPWSCTTGRISPFDSRPGPWILVRRRSRHACIGPALCLRKTWRAGWKRP